MNQKTLVSLYFVVYVDHPELNEVQAWEQPTRYRVIDKDGGYTVSKERACLTPLAAAELFIKDVQTENPFVMPTILGRSKMRVIDKAIAFRNFLQKEQENESLIHG